MTYIVRKLSGVSAVLRRESGATAVEYALMVTFIAIVIIIAVLTLGNKLSSVFGEAASLI
jgi:pilus assembly protein Flp/PilA